MKKTRLVILVLLLLAAPAAMQAQYTYTNADGSVYTYDANGLGLTITGYTGPGGEVIIPSFINNLEVLGIGGGEPVFYGTSVTSVKIPGFVNSIGEEAFFACTSLTNVNIPASVLGTEIGTEAFLDCPSLTNVLIPGNVTSIGTGAFQDCPNLTSVYFTGNPPAVGSNVFYGDPVATAYYLPGTSGWNSTFAGLPVMENSFDFNVTLYGTITITGYIGPGGAVAIPGEFGGVLVTTIGQGAFEYNDNLTSVTIPGTVTAIGEEAFEQCGGLTNVTISNGVTSIGEYAFAACLSLTSVTIPGSVTSIGDYAFANCTNLTSVYFQGSAPIAHTTVFYDDPTTVYYLPGTTGWGATFGGAPTALWLLPIPMILNSGPSFGVQSSAFGFVISWATNTSVVVEASSDLANPVWVPFQTNALSNGSFYFSEPLQTNSSGRYYRISAP